MFTGALVLYTLVDQQPGASSAQVVVAETVHEIVNGMNQSLRSTFAEQKVALSLPNTTTLSGTLNYVDFWAPESGEFNSTFAFAGSVDGYGTDFNFIFDAKNASRFLEGGIRVADLYYRVSHANRELVLLEMPVDKAFCVGYQAQEKSLDPWYPGKTLGDLWAKLKQFVASLVELFTPP